MNRYVKAILALTLVLMVAFASAVQAKAPARRAQAADAEFKKLISDYYEAWNHLSADTPAKYYAKDADLIFYDIAPMKYNGWKEYHDGVQKYFFEGAETAKLTPNLDDLKPTYDQVHQQVTNGGGVMPAFKDSLSPTQINDVSAYVSSAAGG